MRTKYPHPPPTRAVILPLSTCVRGAVLVFAHLVFVVALSTGCTTHRVGYVSAETRPAISVGSVRTAVKPVDGQRPAGMLSLKIMPILRNNPESRAALGKESAARLGYDTVSGFLNLEEVYAKWPLGVALLSDSSNPPPKNRAKFTVCMPLPTAPDGKLSAAAARYLRQEIQYLAAEQGFSVGSHLRFWGSLWGHIFDFDNGVTT